MASLLLFTTPPLLNKCHIIYNAHGTLLGLHDANEDCCDAIKGYDNDDVTMARIKATMMTISCFLQQNQPQ